jgi:nitroimidazol reductase NimA-like FMN-containing flavoprotein (pyridoxamine 5'-phosphate oxidase superfamily)
MTGSERAFLARARVCRVGSVDRAGVVHVAPLCHAFDRERRIAYIATGGVTAENLRARRRASLECDDYFEDWDRLRGLVAHARAKVVDRGAELARARRLLKRKFAQYGGTEFDAVIALHIEAVTSWGL